MEYNLRPYQQECINKIKWALNIDLSGNSLCVLPTAAGKSIILSKLAYQLNQSILIIQPTREILEQNFEKLSSYIPTEDIGIYSASLNSKIIKKYTLATIGSIYRKPEHFAHFKFIIIDECHLVSLKNLSGMFMTFIEKINKIRIEKNQQLIKIIGFTATPYRLCLSYKWENGELTAYSTVKLINRMKGFFWKRLLFNISTQELIDQGFLCPMEYIDRSLVQHS